MNLGEELDTPDKTAEGFKRAIANLKETGKVKSAIAAEFLDVAVRAAEAMAATRNAVLAPDSVNRVMQKATLMATAAAGLVDGVLASETDKSKLN